MVARRSSNVGASNSNLNTVSSTATGQGVSAPPAANPVDSAAPALGLETAVKNFRDVFLPAREALSAVCSTFEVGDTARRGATNIQRIGAMPLLSAIQRRHPDLSTANPDVIDARYAAGTALHQVITETKTFLLLLEDTARIEFRDGWTEADKVKASAEQKAKKDPLMALEIAPVRQILARGPRANTALVTTAVANHNVTKAQTRAAVAQHKAQVVSASQTRTAQAHAARHPLPLVGTPAAGPVSNQGPSGAGSNQGPADATNQGPSATAAASYQGPAVNPQGPAR